MPLAFAYFLAVLVYPLQVWLGDRLPARLQGLAVLLTMLAVVGVLALALGPARRRAAADDQRRCPSTSISSSSGFEALRDWAASHNIQLPGPRARRREPARASGERLLSGLTSLGTISAFALLIFFFTLLMLLEARAWRRKTEAALRGSRTARGARRGRQHRPQGAQVPPDPHARRA